MGLSDGDLVLVDEPAKDLFSADPVLGEVDLRWPGGSLSRRELAEGTVRPGCVVMQQVLSQHPAQVVGARDVSCQAGSWRRPITRYVPALCAWPGLRLRAGPSLPYLV